MPFLGRIGTFLIFVGAALIFLFVNSDIAKTPEISLLFFGALALAVGIFLRWTHPAPPPPPNGRFGLFKKPSKENQKNLGR